MEASEKKDLPEFKTQKMAETDPLLRLAILEESIAALNQKIQIAQGQKKYWQDREDAWRLQIAKKYEYHEKLSNDLKRY